MFVIKACVCLLLICVCEAEVLILYRMQSVVRVQIRKGDRTGAGGRGIHLRLYMRGGSWMTQRLDP